MCHCGNYEKYTRRDFLQKTTLGLGAFSMASLMDPGLMARNVMNNIENAGPHFAPKAKRVIYLFQSGGPSQQDLFDYKPLLNKLNGQEIPKSILGNQRLTGMSGGQGEFPLAGSHFNFKQHGQSGAWVSDLMPFTSEIVDDLCFIKSMYTEAINHDPAATFIQTGSQLPGRPSLGAWLSYGLGSENENLPNFVVLVTKDKFGQPLYKRLWGNGFLPSHHQGVQFRAGKHPVLYLHNPPGVEDADRRSQLDVLKQLEEINLENTNDPEIEARINQYEMAYRMQTSVPEVMDVDKEPDYIYDMYGPDSKKPGTYAANALLARRLIEKGVKSVQLYHQGWDHHGNLPNAIKVSCKETDQPTAALIKDLKQRGLLEDTLVVWGGEFGRTSYTQGQLTSDNYGRDHHPRCFTIFMAGAGVKGGFTYGATDDFGYNLADNPMHVHDLQATILHLMGLNHEKLTYKHQGRRYRLTDQFGVVNHNILT
tara:strand:- start:3851 stop:5290 length:1440 start_codon:yes stop_codon:yes gene_type:complete